jgi:hypothetical protein
VSTPSNGDRAEWARIAVEAFREETHMVDDDLDTVIGDLFCDLRHLAARERINNLEAKWTNSEIMFQEERDEDEADPMVTREVVPEVVPEAALETGPRDWGQRKHDPGPKRKK